MKEYKELAARAKAQDTDAFGKLYALIYEDLYHMAFYMLGNAEDAQDAVSEAVLAAFMYISSLRDVEAFRGWIFKILVNQCKKKLRQYKDRPYSLDAAQSGASAKKESAGEAGAYLDKLALLKNAQDLSQEEAIDVRQAFLRLPDTERSILAMALFGGYKSEEIGKLLQMHAGTVRTRQRRALKKLEQMLSGEQSKRRCKDR